VGISQPLLHARHFGGGQPQIERPLPLAAPPDRRPAPSRRVARPARRRARPRRAGRRRANGTRSTSGSTSAPPASASARAAWVARTAGAGMASTTTRRMASWLTSTSSPACARTRCSARKKTISASPAERPATRWAIRPCSGRAATATASSSPGPAQAGRRRGGARIPPESPPPCRRSRVHSSRGGRVPPRRTDCRAPQGGSPRSSPHLPRHHTQQRARQAPHVVVAERSEGDLVHRERTPRAVLTASSKTGVPSPRPESTRRNAPDRAERGWRRATRRCRHRPTARRRSPR